MDKLDVASDIARKVTQGGNCMSNIGKFVGQIYILTSFF
jgi:hypothetical protein